MGSIAALPDGNAFADDAANHKIRHLETDQNAPAKLAVDREIEESETAETARKLAPDADARVDDAVREIDEDVGDGDEHRVKDGGTHDDGIVSFRDRFDELTT